MLESGFSLPVAGLAPHAMPRPEPPPLHHRVVHRRGFGKGQVELARDRLHAGAVEPIGVEHDGRRIALQRRFGEHVDDGVAELGHAASRFCSRKVRITSSPALV